MLQLLKAKQILTSSNVSETAITTLSIIMMMILIVLLGLQIIFIIYGNEVRSFFKKFSFFKIKKKQDTRVLLEFINNLASVLSKMSKEKTGALIVIENKDNLAAYINIGNRIDSPFNPELVVSIFYNKLSALHDGAMIIRNWRIISLSSYLPVTKKIVSVEYGARHRAAIGICERYDCFSFVVSETTGNITIVHGTTIKKLSSVPEELADQIAKIFAKTNLLTENKSLKNVDIVMEIEKFNKTSTEKTK